MRRLDSRFREARQPLSHACPNQPHGACILPANGQPHGGASGFNRSRDAAQWRLMDRLAELLLVWVLLAIGVAAAWMRFARHRRDREDAVAYDLGSETKRRGGRRRQQRRARRRVA
jgi:hypothetical protein